MFLLGGNFGCPSLKLYNLVYPNAGCTHCSAFHYDNGLGERASTQEAMQLVRKKRPFRGSTTVGSQYIVVCLVESWLYVDPSGLQLRFSAGKSRLCDLKKMASSILSPGSAMLRLLSSRVTSSNSHSLPIWSCRSSDLLPQSPLVNCLAPKPTSMSPFLGVRFCSSTTIETPKSTSSKSPTFFYADM